MVKRARKGLWAVCVFFTAYVGIADATPSDIVLYATDATNIHGNWSLVADSAAAGSHSLASVDNGWSNTTAPLASPADYFEFTFTAAANTPYHVWFRLKAGANSKYNDSVFVQYSDALANGAAVYPIGTTSGLTVNLATDAGAASLSGWGWQDGAYWLAQSTIVSFSSSGSHTLRVQTREDGVSLDQVVLSPATYLTTAPGPVTNDHTIVSKPVASTPFLASAASVPGTIQAANFDNGGEGVAYHDTTAGNAGGAYRQTDVDLAASAEGGYCVGWISPTEWLNFSVNVASAGPYLFEARVASLGPGGIFHLESGGVNLTGPVTVPNTGDWQAWTTVSTQISLNAGTQVLKVVFDTAGPSTAIGNLSWMRFTAKSTATISSGSTPYTGTPISLPGTIHSENFDNGGQGVAYYDTTPGNSGGAYRQTDVDIQASSFGGYNIGWTADGEWLAYTVNVAAAGAYTVQFQVASPSSSGQIHASIGSVTTAVAGVPNTGDWQNWTTISVPVTLAAGQQVMKVVLDTGGFNLGAIVVAATASLAPPTQTWTVNAGGDLQAAINSAQPGDTIVLQAGATFTGNFVLPEKSGSTYITIRSNTPDSELPGSTTRMDPSYAPLLAKIQSPNSSPAMATNAFAHHYKLMLLEFESNLLGMGDIITLGDGSTAQNTLGMVPHDLIVDRVYVHGDVTYGQKRGISLNSASTSVLNSYVSEIKAPGQDSQAVGGWNGPGPFVINNNYLEAAGENVMFGGSDPAIPSLVPSDITFTHNYLAKQLVWRTQTQWSVKNIFELKNAQRVVVDSNIFEYNWQSGQVGYSIVFTPRNQDGACTWCVVQNVQFTNNIVRHVAAGLNILGTDYTNPSQLLNHVLVRNNVFTDVSSATYGGTGLFALVQGGDTITIDHNTVFQDGSSALYGAGVQATNFVFTNNIIPPAAWTIMGDNASPGNGAISSWFPLSQILDNIFVAANASTYPVGNYYPASMTAVGFVNQAGGDYHLASTSPYKRSATDGTDVGCNIDALNTALGTE